MPPRSLNGLTYAPYTRVLQIQACRRGELFANRNVAKSTRGVVGSRGTNTPIHPRARLIQAITRKKILFTAGLSVGCKGARCGPFITVKFAIGNKLNQC